MNVIETKSAAAHREGVAAQLFCSYSHADEAMWKELEKHLEGLRRTGLINVWSDRQIEGGDDWADAIDSHLENAQIVMFLISADFLASTYCMDIEVKRAMERHASGEAVLIPIILRPVDWFGHPLSKFQALPNHAKPVTQWANRDEGFLSVTTGLRRIIENFQRKNERSPAPPVEGQSTLESHGALHIQARRGMNRVRLALIAVLTVAGGLSAFWFKKHIEASLEASPVPPALVTHTNSVDKSVYVRIPAGRFIRGCSSEQPACFEDAKPSLQIEIAAPFWMAQTPVTNQEYQAYLKATSTFPFGHMKIRAAETPYDPVTYVRWQDANNYCQWVGGRLPFEAEWEYAAKSGGNGGEPVGWFLNDSGSGTHRVATVPPNQWLLYDTLGNVWEWCLNWYDSRYYARSSAVSPLGPETGTQRVVRGGSWREDAGTIFTYTRHSLPPDSRADNVGFRCVVDNPSSNF